MRKIIHAREAWNDESNQRTGQEAQEPKAHAGRQAHNGRGNHKGYTLGA